MTHSTASTMFSPSSEPPDLARHVQAQWGALRDRLWAKGLATGAGATLSLRVPGGTVMWHGAMDAAGPQQVDWRQAAHLPAAAVLAQRQDVCAVLLGGGPFGALLGGIEGLRGRLPRVFDEQVRHLGRMPPAQAAAPGWATVMRGGGNAVLLDGQPLVLGTTATRLALNAELFEKCAKACVLAAAAGGPLRPLPWIVRHVANGRLLKDERRARERVAQGLLPRESQGY